MITRRQILGAGGVAALAAGLGASRVHSQAAGDEYRALVVVYLNGGSDGNNVLVPTDAAYSDYQTGRQNLAIPRASLAALAGSSAGHTFGVHPSLRPLVALYNQQRLAFVANVGSLVQPCTAAQVLDSAVDVPPFLLSHNDQTAIVQGWTVTDDTSGWAGRGAGTAALAAASSAGGGHLGHQPHVGAGAALFGVVHGQRRGQLVGPGRPARPQDIGVQTLSRMAQWQFCERLRSRIRTHLRAGRSPIRWRSSERARQPWRRLPISAVPNAWPPDCATWPR
jgi:uncharacterized protein (DUF1501 family)